MNDCVWVLLLCWYTLALNYMLSQLLCLLSTSWIRLLSWYHRLQDDEICDNLLLLLFAGHDTSSVTLTQALANIHEHPEVMEVCRCTNADKGF